MSNSLQPHELQHTMLPCPSLSLGVCANSCPLNWWCHPTISSSVVPFCPCPQSFPASVSFPVSRLFTSGGQSIGTPASVSVLSMNILDWFPLWLTGLISLLSKPSLILSRKGLCSIWGPRLLQLHLCNSLCRVVIRACAFLGAWNAFEWCDIFPMIVVDQPDMRKLGRH